MPSLIKICHITSALLLNDGWMDGWMDGHADRNR